MGNSAAIASLDRVIKDHAPQLEGELLVLIPKELRAIGTIPILRNAKLALQRGLRFPDGGEELWLDSLSIDELAKRFPCCHVGH